jgi:hypothetical protein
MVGALILTYAADPDQVPGSLTLSFARDVIFVAMNIYAVKMAGVFMFVTSTLALRTGFLARWIDLLGIALALLLVLSIGYLAWILVVFPLWVLLVSLYILFDTLRAPRVHTEGDVTP